MEEVPDEVKQNPLPEPQISSFFRFNGIYGI